MEGDKGEEEKENKNEAEDKPNLSFLEVIPLKIKTVEDLAKKEIEPFEFLRTSEINVLLDSVTISKIAKKNLSSYNKWLAKRGKDFNEITQSKTKERFLVLGLIDELVRTICGHYGIAGGDFVDYRNFAESLFKRLERQKMDNWKETIEDRINYWKITFKSNEEILKIIALAIAKFTTKYLYEGLI